MFDSETINSGRIAFTPIGYVERDADAPTGAEAIPKLRTQTARIVVNEDYAEALDGISAGADLVIISYLHKASRDVLQVHPRGDEERPKRGVFSTRSPARPNPIGITTVRVERIEGCDLFVTGLDVVDETPVLDIKPHAPGFDTPYTGESNS